MHIAISVCAYVYLLINDLSCTAGTHTGGATLYLLDLLDTVV